MVNKGDSMPKGKIGCVNTRKGMTFKVGDPVELANLRPAKLHRHVESFRKVFGEGPFYVMEARRNGHADRMKCCHHQLIRVAALDGSTLTVKGGGKWWCGSWFKKVDRRKVAKGPAKPVYREDA